MPYAMPKVRSVRHESNVPGTPTTTVGTQLPSSATPHAEPATKTTIIAATTFETDWVWLIVTNNFTATTITDSLVNIYIGAAGSEQLLIPNLLAGWVEAPGSGQTSDRRRYVFPLRIPAGTRISGTHRSVRASNTTLRVRMRLFGGGEGSHWTGTGVESVGAVTASSRGTLVTAGTTSDGTFTALGTTAHDWGYVLPMVAGCDGTALNSGAVAGDLGVGSVLIPGLDEFYYTNSTAETSSEFTCGRFCFIPAGTALQMRLQTSGTASNQSCVAYGVY
jgi:hypothetical protein